MTRPPHPSREAIAGILMNHLGHRITDNDGFLDAASAIVEAFPAPVLGDSKPVEAFLAWFKDIDPADFRSHFHAAKSGFLEGYRRTPHPEHPAVQPEQGVREAAQVLTPDQLVEEIAGSLERSDPDVAPWAVKWADDIATAIQDADPTPKAIAAALRALSEGDG